MRPLIIGESERKLITDLIERASQNERKIATDTLLQDNRSLTIELPHGYIVTYTHEEQPSGRYRHISVSVDKAGKVPNVAAIEMICAEFAFVRKIHDCMVWVEEFEPGRHAVNVLESLDASSS